MQISDALNQYNRNTATGATATAPQQGVQQLVAAVREMTVGNVFEGTVNDMRHGQVLLGLSNGQTIGARVAGNVNLSVGQSMFFQVKSNDGTTVEIRPYTNGNMNNPTLLKALDAAGITAEPSAIEMVDSMMEEQLPIDRKSLQDMARTISGFGMENIKTLVQMSKLGIPITQTNVEQFVNYKSDQAAIMNQFEEVVNNLGEIYSEASMTEEQTSKMNQRVLDVLLQGIPQKADAELTAEQVPVENVDTAEQWSPVEVATNTVRPLVGAEAAIVDEQVTQLDSPEIINAQTAEMILADTGDVPETGVRYYPANSLGALLSEQEAQTLGEQLLNLTQGHKAEGLFVGDRLNLNLTSEEFLTHLQQLLSDESLSKHAGIKKLLSGREYLNLLRDVAEQSWTIKPEDVKADTVKNLYERLDHQMQQLQQIVKETGQEHTPLGKSVEQVQGNLDFMNQISNAYHYVQLPLKMSGQNAQSELYVYSNKKNLDDKDGDLSAFLHLDMKHLGSTDVSVHMRSNQVHTDFFMEDDKSFVLIQEHAAELAKRLEEKGYSCSIQVENHGYKMNLIEDFMKKDKPAKGGLHRYSFDVRA